MVPALIETNISGHSDLLRTRLDPIVAPGKVSSHVHTVVGSSNFVASETFADARSGTVSSWFNLGGGDRGRLSSIG